MKLRLHSLDFPDGTKYEFLVVGTYFIHSHSYRQVNKENKFYEVSLIYIKKG